jgi:hypothetical protein
MASLFVEHHFGKKSVGHGLRGGSWESSTPQRLLILLIDLLLERSPHLAAHLVAGLHSISADIRTLVIDAAAYLH